jgi:hypothetical protein
VGERDNVYTFGSWLVKPRKEGDFIFPWETFARRTGGRQAGMKGEARLLQDNDEARRFSFDRRMVRHAESPGMA